MKETFIVFSLYGVEAIGNAIHAKTGSALGVFDVHYFPDQEVVVQIQSDVKDKTVLIIATLNRPNAKFLPLIFMAETLRSLGAKKVILIAPYLAYMRQDKVFLPGQGVTSSYFAKALSAYFDGLITVDPHLHRWHDLGALYTIPTQVLHSADCISDWVAKNVFKPVFIGPDAESAQWVSEVAQKVNAPYLVLRKIRSGDSLVRSSIPEIEPYRAYQPVLLDDIISTGRTMMETMRHLKELKMPPPVCIGVHAVFAEHAYDDLLAMKPKQVISCNTMEHVSNGIDISELIAEYVASM